MSGAQVTVSKLTPDGILGYAKSLATFVGGLLTVLVAFLVEGPWKARVIIAIAVCTYIASYQLPNKVKPVVVQTVIEEPRVLGADPSTKVQLTSTPVPEDDSPW